MTRLTRRLVLLAVTLSSPAQRERRREQWLADLDGVDELGLNGLALAIGALTTALLHRRERRRSTLLGSDDARSFRNTRPSIRVPSLLIALAGCSMICGVQLVGAWAGSTGTWYVTTGVFLCMALLCVVPGILFMVSATLGTRVSRHGRVLVVVASLALVGLFAGCLLGSFRRYALWVPDWLFVAVVSLGTIVIWFSTRGYRGVVWTWIIAPPAVAWLLGTVGPRLSESSLLPVSWTPVLTWSPVLAPFVAAVAVALAAGLADRAKNPVQADASPVSGRRR